MKKPEQETPPFNICPYWREFVVKGNRVLALCAAETEDQQPLPDIPDFPRLKECPYFGNIEELGLTPYISPSLIYVENGLARLWKTSSPGFNPGMEGIKQLKKLWPEEVRRFLCLK